MDDLIFLVHRIPYPPNKGDKIRSWHILKHLSVRYRVHLGCFVDDDEDWAHTGVLEELCASTCIVGQARWRGHFKAVGAMISNEPLSVAYYRDRRMRRWVAETVRDKNPAAALLFSSQMAVYLPELRPGTLRVVMDFVDVDSDKWAQYAAAKSGPVKLLYQREARRVAEFEAMVASIVDASLFVSEREADLFRSLVPKAAAKTHALTNGVDADVFSPEQPFDCPFEDDEKAIVFTGAMDYWPNVDAVVWFADHVLARLRATCPEAVFYIVGFKPVPEVQALGDRDGVVVTGAVPDTKNYLAHADCVVAPVRIARGIQNKVLEGMSMAKPVIASPQAAEGLDRIKGAEIAVIEDASDMADAIIEILKGGEGPDGLAARARVIADYGWDANLQVLDRLLEG